MKNVKVEEMFCYNMTAIDAFPPDFYHQLAQNLSIITKVHRIMITIRATGANRGKEAPGCVLAV